MNHRDRVAKNYSSLCERCLRHPNRDWDNEVNNPAICEWCFWFQYYKETNYYNVPEHMEKYLIDQSTLKD